MEICEPSRGPDEEIHGRKKLSFFEKMVPTFMKESIIDYENRSPFTPVSRCSYQYLERYLCGIIEFVRST